MSKFEENEINQVASNIGKLIALCDLNVSVGEKFMTVKINKKYTGQKTMRVLGDVYGRPVSKNKEITFVEVNVKKFRAKLISSLDELKKEQTENILSDILL